MGSGDGMINEELLSTLRAVTQEEQALLSGSDTIQRSIYMDGNSNVIDAKKLLDSGRLIAVRPHTRFVHFSRAPAQLCGSGIYVLRHHYPYCQRPANRSASG